MKRLMKSVFVGVACICLFGCASITGDMAKKNPNIIIILVDDMGYSDIGCYGGEIQTPNIDKLAKNGLRFRQFYNTGRCCPTRASLLTGLHPHQAGVGHMTESPGRASKRTGPYQGYINNKCVTIAEVLKPAGYHTLMSGKWHVGYHRKETRPVSRGFDKFYGIISGAAHYFKPSGSRGLTLQDQKIKPEATHEGEEYYITDAFTDYAMRFIDEANREDDKPFFLYLAYNAPHWPLHAKKKDLDKYLGKYSMGWDKLKQERFERMKKMGIIGEHAKLPKHSGPAWDSLSDKEKEMQDLRMAAYAACIDSIDQNIGKLVQKLKDLKKYENTVIFFLEDNGACAEGGRIGKGPRARFFNRDVIGGDLGLCYGQAWANVSAAPFRRYKHWVHEGGMRTPMVVHWPKGIKKKRHNSFVENYGYLPDFMPTCVELAGAKYPKKYKDRTVQPMEGKSLVPLLVGADQAVHTTPICWEHEGNRAVRDGNWKLVKAGGKPWELYDISKDPTEMNDLARSRKAKHDSMVSTWNAWADRVGAKR